MNQAETEALLNHSDQAVRLETLKKLKTMVDDGSVSRPVPQNNVNNHIHTVYSFSPYSPSMALWKAYNAGLQTAGIMDHDSVAGGKEFLEAGRILDMAVTVGAEIRVDMSKTALKGKKINNPDQKEVAYMAIHGIAEPFLQQAQEFFGRYRESRNDRNREMVGKINEITETPELRLDFDRDVIPLSQWNDGGSVTERHLLFALAKKLAKHFENPDDLMTFLEKQMDFSLSETQKKRINDKTHPFYCYDLLGILKTDVRRFYLPADSECPYVTEALKMCEDIHAVSAYAYLGDIESSVTGDKRAQKFEDDYLELLFKELNHLGFKAVTYMPSRNTKKQLGAVRKLAEKYGLFEISGEDINQPRQSFICEPLKDPYFSHLFDATYALIAHEKLVAKNPSKGMFSESTVADYSDLRSRVKYFKGIFKEMYPGIKTE